MIKGLTSIVIVHYKNPAYLLDCIGSLFMLANKDFEVIVVDNNSRDTVVESLEGRYQLKIIRNKENVGFAEGNNIGIKAASGEFVLFLNDDTEVEADLLDKLLDKINSDSAIAAVQPKIMLKDRPQRLDGVGSFPTITGFLNHVGMEEVDYGQYDHIQDIFSPKGSCLLVRREVLDRVGYFDADYFAYFEETDLAWRIWLSGYRIVFAPEAKIYHKRGATTRLLDFEFIQFHSNKNRICSYIKNLEFSNLVWLLPLNLLLCVLLTIYSCLRFKFTRGLAIYKAVLWNIAHIDKILQKRHFVQKRVRRIKDKTLFRKLLRPIPLSQYLSGFKWFVTEKHQSR